MKDKEVFKFDQLDCEKLAYSLGLANAPQIGFIQKNNAKNSQREKDDEGIFKDENGVVQNKKLTRLQVLR